MVVGIFSIGEGPVRANEVEQPQPREVREKLAPLGGAGGGTKTDALAASEVARYAGLANAISDIDEQRVEEARRHVEEGIQKIQEVVQIVAARISKYIQLNQA